MTIKTNTIFGWLISRYYKWVFNGNLAQDLCTLFWSTLASLPLLPFTIPAYLASFIFGKEEVWEHRNLLGKAFRGMLVYFFVFVGLSCGIGVFERVFGAAWRTWDFWPVIGAALLGAVGIVLTLILIIGSIIGICAAIYYTHKAIINSFKKKVVRKIVDEHGREYTRTYYESKEIKAVLLWNAIRSKYCTKIEWR